MTNHIKLIVSGGQTGVDRAALDVAIDLKIPHGGWCPQGRKAEDGIIPSTYQLIEAPAPDAQETDPNAIYNIRTELNVRDSDGTLIILKDEPIGGTLFTIEMVKKYKKLYFIFYINKSKIEDVANWIMQNKISKLNVAGPRASQTEGIYSYAYDILKTLLCHSLLINEPTP